MKVKITLYEKSNLNSNFRNWFGNSKIVDSEGKPLVVYHGTQRPDRVGTSFNPKRASSGPMPYFTSDPTIASGYAQSKRDTSIADEESYANRFQVKPKGRRVSGNIIDYWYYLPYEKKEEIAELAPLINRDEDGNIFIDETGGINSKSNYDWYAKQSRGNWFKVLEEIWLSSGELFNEEKEFMKVLALLNLPDEVIYNDPNATYPGVYPVYLAISNPLYSNNVTPEIVNALIQAGKRKRKKSVYGNDAWDKNIQDPKEWLQRLKDNDEYVWTSIPDWVTDTLKSLGYNGIVDIGNKSLSTGIEHNVYIPFYPWQIKSIYNKGSWSHEKNMNENNND